MRNIEGIIFDMDGCLYPLDRGSGKTFGESNFGKDIKAKEIQFIQEHLHVDASEATHISNDIKNRHNRHLSLGLEREHGIHRGLFFAATWDLQPAVFIDKQPGLDSLLNAIPVKIGLLTAAPHVWATRVLDHLGVHSLFSPNITCGDQDVRKPDPAAFQQVADMLQLDPSNIVSIGDQEHTDIAPAQSLGMMTVKIGGDTTNADVLAPDIFDAINQLNNRGLL